jgi:hypothetical protein
MITERVSDYWESEWLLIEWVITERVSDYWESEWLLREWVIIESEWLLREWVITERVSNYWESEWLLFIIKWTIFQQYHGQEQVGFHWDNDDVYFVLDHHGKTVSE